MARTNSKERRAAQEEAELRRTVLSIPGVVGEPIWQELADEAEMYLKLYKRLTTQPLNASEREALEDNLILSLAHLTVHSQVLYNSVDEALDTYADEEQIDEVIEQDTFEKTSEAELQDSFKVGTAAQESLVSFWAYLERVTVEHSEKTRVKRLELEKAAASRAKQAKKEREIARVLDDTAVIIEQHTRDISAKLPEYKRSVGRYVEAYAKFVFWLASADQGNRAERQELRAALVDFRETLQMLIKNLTGYIDNVQSTARSAVENLNHTRLNDADTDLVRKLVGILDTTRELDTFTENILTKLEAEG